MHTLDRERNKGGDNPVILLPVLEFVVVPAGPSSRIAYRWGRGVLLRFDRWLEEDSQLGGGLDH